MLIQSEEQEQEMYFNHWYNKSVCTQKAVKKVILRTDGADCPPQKKLCHFQDTTKKKQQLQGQSVLVLCTSVSSDKETR